MNYVHGSWQQEFGTDAEKTVEEWLKELGWGVVRLCTIRNYDGIGAPLLMGAKCNIILPDLQAFDFTGRRRPPFFVEVKHKTQSVENYKLGYVHVHGFGRTGWQHQKRVEEHTGIPVWTVVLEALSGELLAARLTKWEPDDEWGDASRKGVNRGGMVYFRKARFPMIAQLARIQQVLPV